MRVFLDCLEIAGPCLQTLGEYCSAQSVYFPAKANIQLFMKLITLMETFPQYSEIVMPTFLLGSLVVYFG